MAIFQVESDTCHGRGFSREDSEGFLAKLASFLMRPASDGGSQNFTVNATTDQATCGTHGYSNGDPIVVTSTTTLPDPLAESTEYYVIYVDANTFQFAETYGDAVDGTAINLTDTGTGTHSVYAKGGGANLNVWADYSDATAQTFATTDVNTGTDQITLTAHGLENYQRVQFTTSGGLPAGLTASTTYYIIVVDANTIEVATSFANALAGTQIDITTVGSGTHTLTPYEQSMIFCNTVGAAANDIATGPDSGPPKFVRISMYTEDAGYVNIQFLMWHDTSTFTSYGIWFGQRLATYDDADFVYDVRGGDEMFVFSTRLGSSWYVVGLDTFVGDANLLEGTDKVGVDQSGASAGSSVVMQLDTGEAANFTADSYYYILDFDGQTKAQYVKVESVNAGTDQITIETLHDDVAAGAIIGAYIHRWVGFGNGHLTSTNLVNFCVTYLSRDCISTIPYVSSIDASYVMNQNFTLGITGSVGLDAARNYLTKMAPDDEGNYAVMRPGVYELSIHNDASDTATGMNRGYGVLKNTYLIYSTSLSAFLDGKTIGGSNYLFTEDEFNLFNAGNSNYAVLVLDTESTS